MATRTKVTAQVEGRELTLSNLDKVLYPTPGFTKRDVLEYYRRISAVLLPHVSDRAATLIRFPDGVGKGSFYEKNVSRHAPDWVRTAALVSGARGQGLSTNHHVVVNDVPTLMWTANLAALELHVPQWTVGPDAERHTPDLLVFDLDPGPPASIVECCRVALRLRDVLADEGFRPYPKTSGSKGMQLYCPVSTTEHEATSRYAKKLARQLEQQYPDEIIATMTKAARAGKIFIDWSQNNPAKTTVAPYSLRAREMPTVSTPITWREVHACRSPEDLVFRSEDVLARVDEHGDFFADLHDSPRAL
ncbi:ATP-dependent DNA ligase [Allosaccharopolyspora coralli]|uniref:ATP-dependent DNA ligase n=1 Tax=Allosaccharopolyspora coralli TaxID=2665642 RepID=A0A5Q3QEX4_9PSEU|nr:non-homologous end-joining DNA ligase [Allosaccharopolyspora coralli]QGK70065.1 ATP-dependent DNA ligase [Allosaccharopolyspora coralli]